MSGTIELSEFAVLARDLRVFAAFDASGDGSLDAAELLPALAHLGLVASAEVAARVLAAWDEDNSESIDLAEFSSLVSDIRVFMERYA